MAALRVAVLLRCVAFRMRMRFMGVVAGGMLSMSMAATRDAGLMVSQRHALARRHGAQSLNRYGQGNGEDGQQAKHTLQHGDHSIGAFPRAHSAHITARLQNVTFR